MSWYVTQALEGAKCIKSGESENMATQLAQVQWNPATPDSRNKKFCIHGGKPHDKWLMVGCIQCQRVRNLKVGSQHTDPKWQDKLWEVIRTHQ